MTTTSTSTGGTPPASSSSDDGALGAAKSAASRVADEAPQQAGRIVEDAKSQLSGAARRTMADVRSQADERAAQTARMLGDLAGQADALAAGRPDDAGALGDAVQAVGQHAQDWSRKLESGGLDGVANDLARFGRRHPLTFLGLSIGAGFLAGRLLRTGASVVSDSSSNETGSVTAPGAMPTPKPAQAAAPTPAPPMPAPTGADIRP